MDLQLVADALAAAFIDGDAPWSEGDLVRRAAHALGRRERWLSALARRTIATFPICPRDRFGVLAAFLAADAAVIRACHEHPPWQVSFGQTNVAKRDVHAEWGLPRMDTSADVARWLGLEIGDLLWFADVNGFARHRRDRPLQHYHRRWLPKRSGGVRLVEAPKRWLKEVQRRLLYDLLDRIPPHDAAHGFRRRRGIVTHATAHSGRAVVLRIDLEDFFATIPAPRVAAVFRGAGYTAEVARLLTGLCTTHTPIDVEREAPWRARKRYAERHLPQGAPTSPALANLCAFRLDIRLSCYAKTVGATYTRYADDLVFSADTSLDHCATLIAAIALDEGFIVQHRKTRLMRAGTRQEVTGLTVNFRPAIPRPDYERYKAILHNCIRFGPESQNRDRRPDFRAHLEGLVAWVKHVQPARGARLASLLAAIPW